MTTRDVEREVLPRTGRDAGAGTGWHALSLEAERQMEEWVERRRRHRAEIRAAREAAERLVFEPAAE